jgi:putative membrane protein
MKNYFFLFLKGVGIGTANVIPGVSGGTIALITGIFERLINSIKSFNIKAIRLLFTGKIRDFSVHTDLFFLFSVLAGAFAAIISVAKLLEYLFKEHPVQVWAFFFGLVLISVYFVAITVSRWKWQVVLWFIVGAASAFSLVFFTPASQNDNVFYLMICGVVAACSMILPGLSGSFVLILLGNYELVMIEAVSTLNMKVLIPVVIGAGAGLLGFSYILSWIFRKFRDHTISVLSGFMAGSLIIIWPWKTPIFKIDALGELVMKANGEHIITGYNYGFPLTFGTDEIMAFLMILAGASVILILELSARYAEKNKK